MNFTQRFRRLLGQDSAPLEPRQEASLPPEVAQQVAYIAEELHMHPEEVVTMFVQAMAEEYLIQQQQWQSLTEREKDVTRLVCQGLTDDEIAQALDVTYHTVRSHLRKLLPKFNVSSKFELRYYLRHWQY